MLFIYKNAYPYALDWVFLPKTQNQQVSNKNARKITELLHI